MICRDVSFLRRLSSFAKGDYPTMSVRLEKERFTTVVDGVRTVWVK